LLNYYFIIPIYGHLGLHLGEVFVFLCLLFRGLLPAVLATILASAGLYLSTENPALLATTLLQPFVVYFLLKRGLLILVADIFYWIIIGIPITYLVIVNFYQVTSSDYTQLILIKQAINGVLNVSLALLIQPFLSTRLYSSKIAKRLPKLSSRVFELTLICILFPALLVTLILSDSNAEQSEKELDHVLTIRAEFFSELVSDYLSFHQKAIENLSEVITDLDEEADKRDTLKHWNTNYPGFLTMLITDEHGLVTHGVPQSSFEHLLALPEKSRSVSDRAYFKAPKKTHKSYISNVFLGRGFGSDPIVAISAPYYELDKFKGVVEGSLNLPNFKEIEVAGSSHSVIIIDNDKKIIYASEGLGLEPLTKFASEDETIPFSSNLPAFKIAGLEYLYKETVSDNGWSVRVLSKSNSLLANYKNNFYKLILTLVIISVLVLAVSRRFAQQITRPLERLVRYFEAQEPVPERELKLVSSVEVESIRRQLINAQSLMIDYQSKLKDEVAEKTKELITINKKLEQLSRLDQLTQIFNRRGFESATQRVFKIAIRNRNPITFAIIDADNFKKVNDSFGHSAGDKCLEYIGEKLNEVFKRDTDIVGRYGGEEFVVMLAEGAVADHLVLLEQLRATIEEQSVSYDSNCIKMTISIGAYTVRENFDISYEEVIKKADKLLYISKSTEKNKITHSGQ
jgi:diguanylate cyclase (GGDEF)-like protein